MKHPYRSEYFIAHVAPDDLFVASLGELAWATGIPDGRVQSKYILEIGLIALVAHAEAFFKNEFAALVNIHPDLLIDFSRSRGKNVTVDVLDLVQLGWPIETKLGFLISEKQDFTSAKSINGLYRDLIKVTPFSKDEAEEFGRLVNDRNLLVHHGGILTSRHDARRIPREVPETKVFYDALEVTIPDFDHWANFVQRVVLKTAKSAHEALVARVGELPNKLPEAAMHALGALAPKWSFLLERLNTQLREA